MTNQSLRQPPPASPGEGGGRGREKRVGVMRAALAVPPPLGHNSRAMRRFKPVHGALIVLAVLAAIWGAEVALEGRLNSSGFQKVLPDQGQVRVNVADLKPQEVRFFQFLNAGNQEVHFFVGRDKEGQLQVAFDANEQCAKFKRGYRHEGEWMVCNKCDK